MKYKFALVDGVRRLPERGLRGKCQIYGHPMLAKGGPKRMDYWAHQGSAPCDPWWESETEWHRAWKDLFPADWQEYIQHAKDGERHYADVKTHDGWVLEFQHSRITPEERRSREIFYECLIWVIDGMSRKRDAAKFAQAWACGESPNPLSNKRRIPSPKGALLEDWAGSRAHVFFDLGDGRDLWWVFPMSDGVRAYVQHVSRAQFVRIHQSKGLHEFDALVNNFRAFIAQYEPPPPTVSPRKREVISPQPQSLPRLRRHFRF